MDKLCNSLIVANKFKSKDAIIDTIFAKKFQDCLQKIALGPTNMVRLK